MFKTAKRRNPDGFNYAIKISRILLRFLGAWPDPEIETSGPPVHIMFTAATMFLFTTSSQTIKIVQCIKDMDAVIEMFVNCNIPITIATVKLVNVWYHRYVLRDLLRQMISDWETARPDRELAIMWDVAKLSRIFTLGCIFLNTGTLVTQCVSNFLVPISYAMNPSVNNSEERPLYFMGYFPYDTQPSPTYQITIFCQWLSNIFASLSFDSTDSFFVILVFHVIGQLSILQLTIIDLPSQIVCAQDEKQARERFNFVHTTHVRLSRFASDIEDCFNAMFLTQMIPCIFVLCTQGYLLIMITDADNLPIMQLIFMIYFLLLFLFTIFAYCYVAETLRQKSLEISYAAYDCDWTMLTPSQSKFIILIIIRAQTPFELTAGKFASFSLELYCSILKTSAGYLSMLLAVKDRIYD